jgi:D-arabinose 1-dehydrogenase-like Zn-dependent alcohol dehydrogenase
VREVSFFEQADKPNWGTYQEPVWIPAKQPSYKLPAGADPVALAALGCAPAHRAQALRPGPPVASKLEMAKRPRSS